ncbi:AT-rich interactive domain-containing protein 2 isoform X3 [Sitophilus oryzae]|uniref:AT-rich interactive domain-containing protein 2 isoform X3 n=1 Tax=Sitophilus oryzae TaxID=7048 RepID=A0A6J2X7N8_SITOR|nr:AT-rich interactive domain-containing protein 2 isoform X3 [Sitophilus oryzae]
MAEFLGKDQATYSKERDGFLRDLRHFHETRGTSFRRCPTLGGNEVDLYLLYNLVTSEGGWMKVNSKNSWSDFLPHFNVPTNTVNGSVALKQIYLRYLDRWEKVHNLGDEADRASDDDEESRHKRFSSRALHSVPHSYNYSQHNVAEDRREYNHMDINLYKQSDYDRLALSLISPLPNEQDFAINVCTLLSNDSRHTLKLERHPRIITYLLAHAGIFNHSSLRTLFMHFYGDIRKKPIHNFWSDALESDEFLDLTNESKFYSPTKEDTKPCDTLVKEDFLKFTGVDTLESDKTCQPPPKETNDDDAECEIIEDSLSSPKYFKFKTNPADGDLFCLKRTLGTQDYVGQRVLQIATILRNLCFFEENLSVLTKNHTFIRFLLLCASSQWNTLRNLGLDMLGNVANELELKDASTDLIAASVFKIISKNIQSDDRASCLSSVEVLNKLSQNEKNEDVLLRSLESTIYKKVCSFLTIHDVMLLIYTLECLYSLSSLGERSCTFIANNHGVIDTLVSLVTVEGKSYGPKACIGMKLVETIPTGTQIQAGQAQPSPQASPVPQQMSSPSTSVPPNPAINAINSSMVASPAAPSVTPVKMISSTPARNVPMAPQRLLTTQMQAVQPMPQVQQVPQQTVTVQQQQQHPVSATTPVKTMTTMMTTPSKPIVPTVTTSTSSVAPPAVIPTLTPQQMIQQQHAHQQAIHENEQFALAWLRATYEPCLGDNRIDHQELYKQYLNSCSKIGRRGVISPLHFPRCVRSVFGGTVGPNPMKPANPSDPQYYEGIKVRAQPLKLNIPPPPTPPKPLPVVQPAVVPSKPAARRRLRVASITKAAPAAVVPLAVDADAELVTHVITSPASPILKAQLSAPPKQREGGAPDSKSQAVTHPHLSQALLGSTTTTAMTTSVAITGGTSSTPAVKQEISGQQTVVSGQQQQQLHGAQSNSSSLIKSLLATKVAARQQRLLAQQGPSSSDTSNPPKNQSRLEALKMHRINGVRQLFTDNEIGDPSVSSTTQFVSTIKGKKEPPQPPPPPLAPLSNAKGTVARATPPVANEDSDSLGNHSLSSTSGLGAVAVVSSTEDNDNSLTSFEGLLNGMPIVEETLNESSSNSKDSVKNSASEISIDKPLRLADLLEKKFNKTPTTLMNGTLGKDLKLKTDRQDLIENHIEKVLKCEPAEVKIEIETIEIKDEVVEIMDTRVDTKQGIKRHATDPIVDSDAKKPHLSSATNVNGSNSAADSPAPDSSSSNGEEGPTTVSTAAAKLFADIAADILEDEDEEQLMQEAQAPTRVVDQSMVQQQIVVENSQQMVLASQPRQIIVSQSPMGSAAQSVVISSGTQLKTQTGQTVIVQNAGVQQRQSVLIQPNTGQLLLSQGLQGQVQLVPGSQPGQYVLQTNPSQGYVVAQSQTAVVHGQPQTVLVAQQGQNAGAKTIIILQQQPANSATHHQKVMVTPQGQQVVVTHVPRPVVHSSTVSNNNVQQTKPISRPTPSPSPALSTTSTSSTISNGVKEKQEDLTPKVRIARDLTTPFVCEWNDCVIETKFKSPNEVYMHACASHCPQGDEEVICQWDRCDMLKRKRFSLMTHLHDKHCNIEAMKQSLVRRKKVSQGLTVEAPPPTPSNHPGYAPDAALHAIKRHALEFVNPKELQIKATKQGVSTSIKVLPPPTDQDDNEGPVTKSIRLTASLILRNLVIYSSNCKRYLKSYESHLANIALSNVESSRTIAQILYDINDGASPR